MTNCTVLYSYYTWIHIKIIVKKKHKYKSKRHSSIDVFVKRQSDHLHNRRSAVVAQQ